MEDTVQRLLITFNALLNETSHAGCQIEDTDAFKRFLDEKPKTDKTTEALLLQEPPKNTPDIPPSKKEFPDHKPDVPLLLLKQLNTLPEESRIEDAKVINTEKLIPDVPSIENLEQSQLVQLNINDKKIKYMEAQNCILEEYIRQALKHLNTADLTPARKAFLQKYTNALNIDSLGKDLLVDFLDTMPCSFHEINFLYTILKENERR
jgi:hypothetical protein